MRLLNVGCGGVRPGPPWINLDNLHAIFKPGTPERINLDKESNYIDHTLPYPLQFPDEYFDGVLCSHVLEHFTCHDAVAILKECKRVMKQDGLVVVSVPDASYFLYVYKYDNVDAAEELFGEPICPNEHWKGSFFNYALFHDDHKQVLTEETLTCLWLRAGFNGKNIRRFGRNECGGPIDAIMNRRKFSLEMVGLKSNAS